MRTMFISSVRHGISPAIGVIRPWKSGGAPGMAKESNSRLQGGDRLFALDWLGFAQTRVLGDVLRLFSLRVAWLTEGNQKAYMEIVRACRAADPHIREAAEILLTEISLHKQPNRSTGASQDHLSAMRHTSPNSQPVSLYGSSSKQPARRG